MADQKTAGPTAQGADDILRVSFKQRLLLSLLADIDLISFRYRADQITAEALVVAVRDRVDALDSLTRNARVACHLGDAEILMDGDVLHAAADRVTRLAGPSELERLCARVLGTESGGQERREKEEARKREERTSGSVSSPGASETETENPPELSETETVTETEEGPCTAHAQKGLCESDASHPDSDSAPDSDSGSGSDSDSDSDSGSDRARASSVSDSEWQRSVA